MTDMPAQMIMQMMLRASDVIGGSEQMEERLKPMAWQYEIEAGAKGFIAAGDSKIEHDFTSVEVIEVDEAQQERFPDWETRMLNSYLLCRWFSIQDPQGDIGWFSRIRIVTLDDKQYSEMRTWQMKGFPEDPPEWMNQRFLDYTNQLHDVDPVHVPQQAICPECQGYRVEIREHTEYFSNCRAGSLEHEGETRYVAVSNTEVEQKVKAHLFCPECEHERDLEDHEYRLE